jgi:hypothetical protein
MTIPTGSGSLMARPPRRAWAAGVVAVLLVAAVGGCGSDDNQRVSSRKANVVTTAAPTSGTAATSTAPARTSPAPTTIAPATTEAPSSEPPPTEPSTDGVPIDPGGVPVPVDGPVCVNSFNPRCGPFRWEPAPPANQPVTIDSVVLDPPHPIAGQNVTVTIQWSDPDADLAHVDGSCDGNGCVYVAAACAMPVNPPSGPWSPPPPRPGAGTLVQTLQFPVAGTFDWEVDFFTGRDGFCPSFPPDPYTSRATVSDSITVVDFPTIPG